MRSLIEKTEELSEVVTTTTSEVYDLARARSFCAQCVIDVDTPSASAVAAEDVDATEDTFTDEGHGLTTGLKGQMTTSDADLPSGLSTTTDYFVIVVDEDTYKLAESLADALAGTAIALGDAGTGTHTFTPTALAGATVKLEKSNDRENWSDVATATDISQDGTVWLEVANPTFRYARLSYTLTAGRLSTANHILAKEE